MLKFGFSTILQTFNKPICYNGKSTDFHTTKPYTKPLCNIRKNQLIFGYLEYKRVIKWQQLTK